uniref:Copia protein n=1 Tax=Tanacetum cinerariifolium TaxID=118510 RepID=A0A6L2JV57_TANCI|nr:copia protein [Tanacetum cinerariifolium]
MLLCKQAEKGVPLQAEQYDWLVDMDEEIDEQELEAHYSYMEKIQEVQNDIGYNVFANDLQHSEQSESISNTCIVERDDSNVIPYSPYMCEDDIQNDQNDVESDDEQIVDNAWVKHTKDQFLAPTAKDMENLIQTCLMPFALKTQNDSFIFVHELKQEMHADLKYVESLEKEIDELESDKAEFSNMYDMIFLNSRTSNANAVCATCGKCLVDSDHFACVTKMLNDVNARTKKPNVVLISTRKPKAHANKSVATPHKKKVSSRSTTQKPKSYYRMLYEKTSKAWKWWIEQQCPSGYKWVPKTKMQWVPKARNENVQKRVRFAVDNASRTTNIIQLILFIVESGCTKHKTGNLKLLCNFVEKYLGFITSKDSITISSQLVNFEMRIWRLLSENLHVLLEIFRKDVMIGLPKLKYVKDQLCSSCKLSKAKKKLIQVKGCSKFERKAKFSSYGLMWSNAENNDNQAEEEHLQDDEFTNPFCTSVQEVAESSSHNIEQVRGNPSKPVQIRRQLATDPEMCMFALTVSTAEPKNIKEAMADSAWIEAMQEELHQLDRLQVWELVDKPFGKSVIRLKWLWKNKKDEDQTVIRSKARLVAKRPLKEEVYVAQPDGFVDPNHPEKGSSFGLTAFSNADHAGCIDTHKSTSRGIQFLGDKLVSWMSKKQDCTAMSSLEAEYVALSASCAQVMWMRTQLQDYGLHYNNIPLYCDSQSAIEISCNPVQHSRTKHIHTQYHFIKEQVENGFRSFTSRSHYQSFSERLKADNTVRVNRVSSSSISSSNAIALDLPNFFVLITGTSQSRQHVDTSLIHLESRKSPTAELFDDDSGRISIHHYEY